MHALKIGLFAENLILFDGIIFCIEVGGLFYAIYYGGLRPFFSLLQLASWSAPDFVRALYKSSRRSSTSSMPTHRRIRSSGMARAARTSAGILACDIRHGMLEKEEKKTDERSVNGLPMQQKLGLTKSKRKG